jgi:pimeloyl-ACP methyl ester carboxylesterase
MNQLVFLHGQPGARSDWDDVTAHLPSDWACLALDRPGYRSNPLPPGGLAANTEWLLSTLDAHGIDRAVLVAHSYGGGIALNAAAMAPERVRALVLLASVGPDCLTGWDHVFAAPLIGPAGSFTVFSLTSWMGRARLAWIQRRLGRPLRVDEHIDLDTWANARHPDGAMWRTFITEQRDLVRNADTLNRAINRVQAPSLLMADPDDTVVPVATARALHGLLPQATLQLIEGGGHSLPRTKGTIVARSITDFVSALD